VRRAFRYPCLALADLQNMVNRLIGETVVRQGVKAADTGEQRPFFLPRTSSTHF
jgi:hypothetical protein